MSAGTFAAFSKFFLNTSKSPNGKVVQFVKAHNFHVEWHCWFQCKLMKNASQCLLSLFTRAKISVKFPYSLSQIL
jgi:hypothetical protein